MEGKDINQEFVVSYPSGQWEILIHYKTHTSKLTHQWQRSQGVYLLTPVSH